MFGLPILLQLQVPPQLHRLLRQAERQIERRNYDQAIASLHRAIARGADAYACILHIAVIYSLEQRWEGAFRAAEQAIALAPDQPEGHEMLMQLAIEAGDTERSLAASQALIKLQPRHIGAHTLQGAIYMQRGDVDAAIRVINILIQIDPCSPAYHLTKAQLCQHKGEVAHAVKEFVQVVSLDAHGVHAAMAQDALNNLDAHQINVALTLAVDDPVFRAKLTRDPGDAATERGFVLSETGSQILGELCAQMLTESTPSGRPTRYN